VITDVPEKSSRSIEVTPNPVEGKFQVQLPYEGPAEIEMLDMNGRVVYSESRISTEHKVQLVPSLPQGLYILRIANGGKTFIEKVSVR
jgi:hypothetical protein